MLLSLALWLQSLGPEFGFLRVFQYLTFRAVMAALAKMGFSEEGIGIAYKGESEPLVTTGDGVREPQNRRVEIVLR